MQYASVAALMADVQHGLLDPTGRRQLTRNFDYAGENAELVGVPSPVICDIAFNGGTVGLRLNKCEGFYVANCSAAGMWNPMQPNGEPGDDGHGFQFINCGGTIHYCWGYANDGKLNPKGTLGSEDTISIFGDEPATSSKHVIIEMCHTYYKSLSSTCTHICIDGPYPPKVTVLQNKGIGPRCYIMVAGGNNHDIQMNASYGADTDIFLDNYYGVSGALDGITVERNVFPQGLLLGKGLGSHNRFQEGRQT